MKEILESFGKYFDEFEVGEKYAHALRKTVTESDNNIFCLLTMNHHPVHLDQEYAKNQIHQKILVVGTYVLSLVVGQSVRDISGKAIANLEYESIKHLSPVFIGDTIHSETIILEKKLSQSNPQNGIIFVETTAFNQNNISVLSLKRKILVPRKNE